jgi:hypothetical protein
MYPVAPKTVTEYKDLKKEYTRGCECEQYLESCLPVKKQVRLVKVTYKIVIARTKK